MQKANARRGERPEFDDHTNRQPPTAPPLETLAGAHIEVMAWVKDDDGFRLHWFAGVVKQVSDGKIARASGRGVYAKGTVLIQFDAQPGEPPEGTEA